MIEIHKEPSDITEAFPLWAKERCVFCTTPTIFWDKSKHNPVCKHCAQFKDENDLVPNAI